MKDIAELFSSPSGDGLVQRSGNGLSTCVLIFVPPWGWVGSLQDTIMQKTFTIFVPVWRWVGSECREEDESFKKFLSPLGDGLVHGRTATNVYPS